MDSNNIQPIKIFPYQERVIEEKADLDEKTVKLNRVICGVCSFSVTQEEAKRMKNQVLAMKLYSNILQSRTDAWEVT